MANEQNLRPGEYKFTLEDAKKGQRNAAKARREKKRLRECLEILLEKEMTDKSGNKITGAEALSARLFSEAMKGNVKAFEVLRDTAGQKPADKVMIADVDKSVIDEVECIVNEQS